MSGQTPDPARILSVEAFQQRIRELEQEAKHWHAHYDAARANWPVAVAERNEARAVLREWQQWAAQRVGRSGDQVMLPDPELRHAVCATHDAECDALTTRAEVVQQRVRELELNVVQLRESVAYHERRADALRDERDKCLEAWRLKDSDRRGWNTVEHHLRQIRQHADDALGELADGVMEGK